MPTYVYQCSCCGERQEHFLPMSQRTDSVPCDCGKEAERIFDCSNVSVCNKGAMRDFKLDATSVPIGWERGNTAEKQEARYRKIVGEARNTARAVDKQAIKGGIRHIAKVPREFHRMRSNQFGKAYLDPATQSTAELKDKLKSDGLLFKD